MKKILSALISLALATSVLPSAFATVMDNATAPTIDFEVTEFEEIPYIETYDDAGEPNGYEYAIPEGYTPYKLTINFNNLPNLTYLSSGTGVALGAFTIKLYTKNLDNIVALKGINYNEEDAGWIADEYGLLYTPSTNFTKNYLDNSISIVNACTSLAEGYPRKSTQATKDKNGLLEGALKVCIAAKGPITIDSTRLDVNINNKGMGIPDPTTQEPVGTLEEYVNVATSDVNYTFGPTATNATIGNGTQIDNGAEVEGNKVYRFSTDATVDFANYKSTAKFMMSKDGSAEKEYTFPTELVGLTNFTVVVETQFTGTYNYRITGAGPDVSGSATVSDR